ncbi:hypothetical protein CEXT_242661 [Caerostris extrusa]|uniref:Uncharacterized protein n=1 Tax=Caerostris extrusa TaxID=172846 RepID=A0AAV4MQX1_CAEEX|nr:hypothetical protein CEXT_242661 [Caerostris extrusa]
MNLSKKTQKIPCGTLSNPSVFFKTDKHQLESSCRAFRKGIPEIPEQSHTNAIQPRHKIVCFLWNKKLRRRCHGKEKAKREKKCPQKHRLMDLGESILSSLAVRLIWGRFSLFREKCNFP